MPEAAGRHFPVVPMLGLVVVVAFGAVVAGQLRSTNGSGTPTPTAGEAPAPIRALTTRFEPQLRRIESALFDGSLDGYQIWGQTESAALEIVEGLRDATSFSERRALIEVTTFVANFGNRIELGGVDVSTLQRSWLETRTAAFGTAPWFHPSSSVAAAPDASAYFYPDRGEDVDAPRVQLLQVWLEEARRIAGVGQEQARRFGEIGPRGDAAGTNAAQQTLADWRNWLQRWENSVAELRAAAAPIPATTGVGVSEYLEIHQNVRGAIDRMGAIQYETGAFGVPDRDHRQAFFADVQRRFTETGSLLRDLRNSVR